MLLNKAIRNVKKICVLYYSQSAVLYNSGGLLNVSYSFIIYDPDNEVVTFL